MARSEQPQMLLHTKLHPPRVPDDLLRRDRLLDQLQADLDRPLTLVSAPAGFGKTTLISSWLQECVWPHAWLSLDEDDSDLVSFLDYLLAAVQSVYPDVANVAREQFDRTNLLPAAVAASLTVALSRPEQPLVLVLDDYHLIHDPAVHQVLAELLRHPLRSLHLVLSTRQDPPLPLGPLRAQNRLGELRSRDLRLTSAEIAAFLQQTLGHTPDATSLSILAEKTEGWVAGLRLAALSLSAAHDLDASVAALTGDNRYVMDYLLAEVLLRQPPARQEFLLKTAILERLSGPLCDALLPPADPAAGAQRCLAELAAANLFTEALDDQQQWFRYHPLFRQLLLHQLPQRYTPAQIALCHARASAWYAAHGQLDEALTQALAAGDVAASGALLAEHRLSIIDQEQWPRLERWLQLLSAESIEPPTDYVLARLWLAYHRGQLSEQAGLLDEARFLTTRLPAQTPAGRLLRGELAALRSHVAFQTADSRLALGWARQALEATQGGHPVVRQFARVQLAAALQMSGNLQAAYSLLDTHSAEDSAGNEVSKTQLLNGRCLLAWTAADLTSLEMAARDLADSVQGRDLPVTLGWARFWQATVHYQRNDLARAESQYRAALEQPSRVHAMCFAYSALGLSMTYQAMGDATNARRVLEAAEVFGVETRHATLLQITEAFQADLALSQGDTETASSWADKADTRRPPYVQGFLYGSQLTLPRVYLAQDTPASKQKAAEILSRLLGLAYATHNTRLLIEVLCLQAILLYADRDEQAALSLVARVCQPGRARRLHPALRRHGSPDGEFAASSI